MASIRKTKKEVSYLANEVISNSYLALYFQPESQREAILGVISKTVELHNNLMDRINNPAEKKNARLIKKHFMQLRNEMFDGIDNLFVELSEVCKGEKSKPKAASKAKAKAEEPTPEEA